MLRQLLTGAGRANLAIRSSNPLKTGDKLSEHLPAAASGTQQAAVPLEYRWITDYPESRDELSAVFKTVLDEVRNANLAGLDAAVRQKLEGTWGAL
jgi:hypothetical protein